MKKLVALTAVFFTTLSASIFAAGNTSGEHTVTISIPKVALLGLEGTTDIALNVDGPTEAGQAVSFANATNSGIWMNYSSIAEGNKPRKVTVSLGKAVPAGVNLKVLANSFQGSGKGTHGTPTAAVVLATSPQGLVKGIGSSYTGDGANNGHNLAYSLELIDGNNYANLLEGNTEITVTYTLVDEN